MGHEMVVEPATALATPKCGGTKNFRWNPGGFVFLSLHGWDSIGVFRGKGESEPRIIATRPWWHKSLLGTEKPKFTGTGVRVPNKSGLVICLRSPN